MRSIFPLVFLMLYAVAGNTQVGLDPSFGNNGIVQTGFGYHGVPQQNLCKQVLLNPDGSFYLLFEMNNQTFIVRRLANGALDNTYGENGYSDPSWVRDPRGVLMPDGSVVVGGSSFGIDFDWNFTLVHYLPNGKLDKTFVGTGTQITDFWDQPDFIYAMALQPDNKIVAVGLSGSHFAIARYLPNGMPDNSFSQDGKDTVNIGSLRDVANAVAIGNDGRIVVAGQSTYFGPLQCMSVAVYLPDGSLDNSFSGDGMDTLVLSNESTANGVTVQPDGKIVLAGFLIINNLRNFAVVRLNADGTYDNSFSGDGLQTVYFTGWDEATTVKIDNNGKIVAAGYGLSQWIVARLNPDGSLDAGFSGNGRSNIQVGLSSARLFSMALQPDGKILVAGEASFYTMRYAAARFNAEGGPDFSFGDGGKIADFKQSSVTAYAASAVQPDGKLITVGSTYVSADISEVCIARYHTNGTLDNSFSGDGKLLFSFANGSSIGSAVALQQDGKIVIAGTLINDQGRDAAVARLNVDGSFDPGFSGDGIEITDLGGNESFASVCIQPDGKIIGGGYANPSGSYTSFAVIRYNINGTRDNSFSGDGVATTNFDAGDALISKVLLQPDGKIIAAGSAVSDVSLMEVDFAVARYNTNGTPDLSFNGTGTQVTSITQTDFCDGADLDANGSIVLAGTASAGSGAHMALVRYLGTGQLDNSFSGDGIVTYGTHAAGAAVIIQPGGGIIAAGIEFLYPNTDAMIVRFNPDGTPDTGFSPEGKIVTDLGGEERLHSLSIFNNRLYGVGRSSYDGSTGLVIAYAIGCTMSVTIPDATTLAAGVDPNTVYIGYAPASDLTLQAQVSGGTAPYNYQWSNGATTSSIVIMPVVAGNWSVLVTDATGCRRNANKYVNVTDVRCGNKLDKVMVCNVPPGNPAKANTVCVNPAAVAAHLNNGSYLGSCRQQLITSTRPANDFSARVESESGKFLQVYPNPTSTLFTLVLQTGGVTRITVYDGSGRIVEKRTANGSQLIQLGGNYEPGVYMVECIQGNLRAKAKLIKL